MTSDNNRPLNSKKKINGIFCIRVLSENQKRFFVSLFGLMLYVHSQQLMSCRDGQLSYPYCSCASLTEAGNHYLAHILSPLTDNCSS